MHARGPGFGLLLSQWADFEEAQALHVALAEGPDACRELGHQLSIHARPGLIVLMKMNLAPFTWR